MGRHCSWCGTYKHKPLTESDSRWESKKHVFCNVKCRSMYQKVNAVGYLGCYLLINNITNTELIEAVKPYYDFYPMELTYILRGRKRDNNDMDAIELMKRIGCGISDLDPLMTYGDDVFDIRMMFHGEGCYWPYPDIGFNGIWKSKLFRWVEFRNYLEVQVRTVKEMQSRGIDIVDEVLVKIRLLKGKLEEIGRGDSDPNLLNWQKGLKAIKGGDMDLNTAKALSDVLLEYGIDNDYRKLIKRVRPKDFVKLKKLYRERK